MANHTASLVSLVQIDGLKIIKHCQEQGHGGPDLARGFLHGLVDGDRLEVTNCLPQGNILFAPQAFEPVE